MAQVLTATPQRITAGDTAKWLLTLADYPAPVWVVSYTLVKAGVKVSFDASPSGADHLISITKATTAFWQAGSYTYQAVATSATERILIETGVIEIIADFAQATTGLDARSHSQKMVDLLRAVIEGRASKTDKQYSIGGRMMMSLTPIELRTELDYWEARLRTEQASDRQRKTGKSRFGSVQVRFT